MAVHLCNPLAVSFPQHRSEFRADPPETPAGAEFLLDREPWPRFKEGAASVPFFFLRFLPFMAPTQTRFAKGASSLALASCGFLAAHALAQELPSAPAAAAAAQPSPIAPAPARKVVRDIRIETRGGRVDEARIRSLLRSRVGEPFVLENTDEDIENLVASGLVSGSPLISQEEVGSDGVRLIYTLDARGSLGSIAFEGNGVIDDERLRRELAEEEVGITTGVAPTAAQLVAARTAIRDLYRDRGYPDVTVDVRESEVNADGFSQVVFAIDEGVRGEVDEIRFAGNTALTEKQLEEVMQTKEKGLFSFLTDSGQINNVVLAEDRERIATLYQDHGYLNARVVEIQRQPVGDDKVDLILFIEEGPQYTVRNISIDGAQVFQPEDLSSEMKLTGGDVYAVSEQREDIGVIRDYYGSRGYTNVAIIPDIVEVGGNQVDIVYRITEGEVAYVGRVNITGNTKTQDRVIRREVPLEPGDQFSTVELDATRQRLNNMGYFEQVDVNASETADPSYEDVNIDVREKSTGSLGVSVGVSSVDALVGQITLAQSNFDWRNWPRFTGAGQRFSTTIMAGTKRRDLQVSFTEPWFMGRKVAFSWDAFYRDLFFLSDVYDQQEVGFRPRLRWPFGENGSLSLIYTLQKVKIDNVDDDASEFLQSQAGDYLQSSLGLEYAYDTRNRIVFPDEGRRVVLGIESTALGSDFDATKFNADVQQFIPLKWDMALKLAGGLEVVDGDDVPVFYRSYLGGPRDLRGFDFRDVSPKDENGEPIGGGTSLFGQAELTFPIVERVRGAVFYDVGSVGVDSFDFGGDLCSDVGVGLRLDLPIGPLQLDLGFPVQTDEFNDEGVQFHFSVGYSF